MSERVLVPWPICERTRRREGQKKIYKERRGRVMTKGEKPKQKQEKKRERARDRDRPCFFALLFQRVGVLVLAIQWCVLGESKKKAEVVLCAFGKGVEERRKGERGVSFPWRKKRRHARRSPPIFPDRIFDSL